MDRAVDRAAQVMAAHYLTADDLDADRHAACICGRWREGDPSVCPGWDDHLAEVLAEAGLLRSVEESDRERDAARAELERLRARDEAAKAVVQAWRANEAAPFEGTTPALFELLDALARTHQEAP